MSRKFELGAIFGIPIQVDASWFAILALMTWTLATGYFPSALLGVSTHTYWLMGLTAAVLLFACVLLHELGHSLVAKAYGIPVRRVTLFVFGGVAQIASEPKRPWVELTVALAGPLVSVVLAAACWWVSRVWSPHADAQLIGLAIVRYLWIVNAGIILFNLLPGFPLDGGRVMRALLWAWTKDLTKATRIASICGSAMGIALVVLGGLSALEGRWINGVWSVLLGFYLRNAARASYADVAVRGALANVTVSQLMKTDRIMVPAQTSLQAFVDTYALRYGWSGFPVEDDGQVRGVVTVAAVKRVARARWPAMTVGELMRRDVARFAVRPGTNALEALGRMHASAMTPLVVMEDGQMLGVVHQADILNLLRMKLELGGRKGAKP